MRRTRVKSRKKSGSCSAGRNAAGQGGFRVAQDLVLPDDAFDVVVGEVANVEFARTIAKISGGLEINFKVLAQAR